LTVAWFGKTVISEHEEVARMAVVTINGGDVAYDILGDAGAPLVVVTPGGRFSKEIPGVRPLAEALVEGGLRVLIWDRPNCGESDVQFYGRTESHMRAETLHGLLTTLELGPGVIAGGSGGARDSLLTVMLYPELARKLILWNIVGGIYGVFALGAYYVLPSIKAVRTGGMEAVIELPEWSSLIEANPKNRDRMLAFDAEEFEQVMFRWLNAFVSKPGQTIPGVDDWMFKGIKIPTLIIRGGEKDIDHPKRTSLEVNCLIEGSKLIDPPWREDAWEHASRERHKYDHYIMFEYWVQAAPAMLDFITRTDG
jgi:2-hydroxy-6-oxonona-2,4-dienedioate hydrolase